MVKSERGPHLVSFLMASVGFCSIIKASLQSLLCLRDKVLQKNVSNQRKGPGQFYVDIYVTIMLGKMQLEDHDTTKITGTSYNMQSLSQKQLFQRQLEKCGDFYFAYPRGHRRTKSNSRRALIAEMSRNIRECKHQEKTRNTCPGITGKTELGNRRLRQYICI